MHWNVSYEIVTPESAEYGDAAERGMILTDARSLRDAVAVFQPGSYVEADRQPVDPSIRWLTTIDEGDYRTGEVESRTLHIPDEVTAASRMRLARVLGCYGLR